MRDAMGQHRDWGPGVVKVIGLVGIGAMRDVICMVHQAIGGWPGGLGSWVCAWRTAHGQHKRAH